MAGKLAAACYSIMRKTLLLVAWHLSRTARAKLGSRHLRQGRMGPYSGGVLYLSFSPLSWLALRHLLLGWQISLSSLCGMHGRWHGRTRRRENGGVGIFSFLGVKMAAAAASA